MTKRQAQSGNIRRTPCEDKLFRKLSGRSFGSQLERSVAQWLAAREENGEISDLCFQVMVHLTRAKIGWRIDFSYMENGQFYYHEAKGRKIEPYPTKLRLFRVYGDAPLRISKGYAKKHKVVETVYPTDYLQSVDESTGRATDRKKERKT